MTTEQPKGTSDTEAILDQHFHEGKPQRVAAMTTAEYCGHVAEMVYHLRYRKGLSQAAFAARVGLAAEVIAAIEECDYRTDDLPALFQKIQAAFGWRSINWRTTGLSLAGAAVLIVICYWFPIATLGCALVYLGLGLVVACLHHDWSIHGWRLLKRKILGWPGVLIQSFLWRHFDPWNV